jgi:vacuolar-type H+-ATPase subunit H
MKPSSQQAINKALDETKDNIRRTTDEARKDIPRYTQIVNEYQEETIQAARQMADTILLLRMSKGNYQFNAISFRTTDRRSK